MDKNTAPEPKAACQNTGARIAAVDIARVLAALFIMYAHIQIWSMNSNMTNFAAGFILNKVITLDTYNCIFFVFAGYFVSRNITWKKAFHNALWCFIPFLFWNIAAFAVGYATMGGCPPCSDGATTFWGVCGSYLGIGGAPPLDGPLWFIRDLAVFFLLSPIIAGCAKWLFPVFLFFTLYTGYAGVIDHDYAMRMVCSPYSLSYFALGCFICKLSKEQQGRLLAFYSVPMLVVYFGLIIVGTVLDLTGHAPAVLKSVPRIPFVSVSVSIWLFYQLCRFLEEKVPCTVKLVQHLAPVSFLVFALHGIVFKLLLPECIRGTNWMVLVPIVVYAVCFLLFVWMKRHARPLLRIVAHYKLRDADVKTTPHHVSGSGK